MGVQYNCFLSHYLDLLTIYVKNKHKKKYTVNQNIKIVLKQLKESNRKFYKAKRV